MAYNILVVDDSAVMRSMIIQTIKLSKIELGDIYEASNGEEGMQKLNEYLPDLVLIDLNMPGMNGLEMLKAIRLNTKFKNLPVCMVTPDNHPQRKNYFKKLNAAIVHKPFTPEQLSDHIFSMLGKQ